MTRPASSLPHPGAEVVVAAWLANALHAVPLNTLEVSPPVELRAAHNTRPPPLSPVVHHQAGQTCQQARQYDRAIDEYRQALALSSNFNISYESMSWAYRRQGEYAEAIAPSAMAFPAGNTTSRA